MSKVLVELGLKPKSDCKASKATIFGGKWRGALNNTESHEISK